MSIECIAARDRRQKTRRALILGIWVTSLAALSLSTVSVAGASPSSLALVHRVLQANEIPGYLPTGPRPHPLGLNTFLKVEGAPSSQRAILSRAGFVHAVAEALKPPVVIPPGPPDDSAVVQLGSAVKARSALPKILGTLPGAPPGFKIVHFAIPAIPGAVAKSTSNGAVTVYSVFFAAGAYIYNVDAATRGAKLSRAGFKAAMTAYYDRVK